MTEENGLAYGDEWAAHIRTDIRTPEQLLYFNAILAAIRDLSNVCQRERELSIALFTASAGEFAEHRKFLCECAGVEEQKLLRAAAPLIEAAKNMILAPQRRRKRRLHDPAPTVRRYDQKQGSAA